MRHWALAAAIGAAILTSSSESPAQVVISGSYIMDEERSDDDSRLIDSALAGLSNRAFNQRLHKASGATPGYAIRISTASGRLSINHDAKPLIRVLINGEPIKWRLEDGQVFDVSAKANGDAISVTFRAPDNERTITYRGDGQQLVTETVITSPLLSTPIRYRLVYNRAR